MSSPRREVEPPPETPEPAVGFHAKLEGASLWDLVQMECLARSRLVVEITGEGGVGYLYFDAGQVVHASTPRNYGLPAAYEILGWTRGTFQASNRSWPSAPTIEMSHESLLLHAAKHGDEARASNLVAFPGRGIEPGVAAARDEIEMLEIEEDGGGEGPPAPVRQNGPASQGGEVDMRNPNIDQAPVPPAIARTDNSADFPVMVRLATNGIVLRNKGGSEELAEVTAYAHRLVQLTGELLGLEEFVALECTFANDRFIVFTENEGDVVALRPRPDLNLQALRERLGL
ncbi:MAG TPA: DUF4388 domain-containing protein [Polyangia bacterium]|jgi:hypothetical protein